MKLAKELMTVSPVVLKTSMTISDCMKIFLEKRISTAPVLDIHRQLVGVMVELNLVKAFAKYTISGSNEVLDKHPELIDKARVVDENMPADQVLAHILKAENHRLVVLDQNKKVTGILSPIDLMAYLWDENERGVLFAAEMQKNESLIRNRLKGQFSGKNSSGILESLNFGILATNPSGQIIYANKMVHEYLSLKPYEMVGSSLEKYLDKASFQRIDLASIAKSKGHQSEKHFLELKMDNGKGVWARAYMLSMFKDNNVIIYLKPMGAEAILRQLYKTVA